MAAGTVAMTSCIGYLVYMNYANRKEMGDEKYVALNEDGSEYVRTRKSKWD